MESKQSTIKKILWADLTVDNAKEVSEFYKEVIGWESKEVAMKDGPEEYSDFAMLSDKDTAVGGVCNARGKNKEIPPQWVMYVNVENVEKSLESALNLGGKLLQKALNKQGKLHYAIIQDPGGAVFGIGEF